MEIRVDPFPSRTELNELWVPAWGSEVSEKIGDILARSLGHLVAYDNDRPVGFVNIAWDGGDHAFILDTCVHPRFRRQGLATRLVRDAIDLARRRGAHWLHVDFEPHLTDFYRRCGFRHTEAGLIEL